MNEEQQSQYGLITVLCVKTQEDILLDIDKRLNTIKDCLDTSVCNEGDRRAYAISLKLRLFVEVMPEKKNAYALYAYVFTYWHPASMLIVNKSEAVAFLGGHERTALFDRLSECEGNYKAVFHGIEDMQSLELKFDKLCVLYDELTEIYSKSDSFLDPFYCRYGVIENTLEPNRQRMLLWKEFWTNQKKEPRMLFACKYAVQKGVDAQTRQDFCFNYVSACYNSYCDALDGFEKEIRACTAGINKSCPTVVKQQKRRWTSLIISLVLLIGHNLLILLEPSGFLEIFFFIFGELFFCALLLFELIAVIGLISIRITYKSFLNGENKYLKKVELLRSDLEKYRYSLDDYYREMCGLEELLLYHCKGVKIEESLNRAATKLIASRYVVESADAFFSFRGMDDCAEYRKMIYFNLPSFSILILAFLIKVGGGRKLSKVKSELQTSDYIGNCLLKIQRGDKPNAAIRSKPDKHI